jgi:hypothetical protein
VARVPPPREPPPPLTQAPPKAAPERHPGRVGKIVALATIAAAVAAGAIAIYTYTTYSSLQTTAATDLTNVMNAQIKSGMKPTNEQNLFYDQRPCTPPASLSGPAIDQYKMHCQDGVTYADATTALWVVAGAFAGAAVISFVVGDRLDAKAREAESGKAHAARLIRQSLRLAPVVSTKTGGLTASFEF